MLLEKERKKVVELGKKLISNNLTTGSGGNISVYNRKENLVAISPSGQDYFKTKASDVAVVDLEGRQIDGDKKPSSELGMHLIFYKNRKDVNGIVHTHSKFATTISAMGWKLPAVHYLIGFAGYDVNVADYAVYGSDELAENALAAIGDRNAVLLANHGLIALGDSADRAFSTAEHLEFVAEIYYRSKSLGEPNILSREEMDKVMKKFGTYKYK